MNDFYISIGRVIFFLVFLSVSWFFLKQILMLSFYAKYYLLSFPLVIIYAVLIRLLFGFSKLDGFRWWYFTLVGFLLIVRYTKIAEVDWESEGMRKKAANSFLFGGVAFLVIWLFVDTVFLLICTSYPACAVNLVTH